MDTTSSPQTSSSQTSLSKSSSSLATRILSAALAIGATVWAVGATTGIASAQTTAAQPASASVTFADLDVNTREGAALLLRRINVAAHEACGGQPVRSPLHPRNTAVFRDCVRDAVSGAVTGFNSPTLAAVHKETPVSTAILASR